MGAGGRLPPLFFRLVPSMLTALNAWAAVYGEVGPDTSQAPPCGLAVWVGVRLAQDYRTVSRSLKAYAHTLGALFQDRAGCGPYVCDLLICKPVLHGSTSSLVSARSLKCSTLP